MEGILYIYYNGTEIKALTHKKSLKEHDKMIQQGWEHTATIDSHVWIEHLFNNCEIEDYQQQIKSLSEI